VTTPRVPREDLVSQIDLGTAELIADPKRPFGWLLMIDGVAQSYVDTRDPKHLEFAYVRRVAAAIDAVAPEGSPIDALHLGGGAWSIPRYVAATRPGSRQRIIERDEALATLIASALPLRTPKGIDLVLDDARDALEGAPDGAYRLIVSDVFQAATMPEHCATAEFAAEVARVLRGDGFYVVNVTDLPALAFTRRLTATLREHFHDVAVVADPSMLRGRRFGNSVLVASGNQRLLPTRRLVATRPGEHATVRILHEVTLDAFLAGARPFRDAEIV
jgi:spermidine synthase